jgi:hypothetical protein
MTDGLPNLRFERKFLPADLDIKTVLARVRRHPALFRETYPARMINNLYFDSADLRSYHEHVRGVGNRVKTRIRWYGPLRGAIARPVLERKLKRGLVSGKAGHPLPPLALNGCLPRRELAEALAAPSLPEMLRWQVRGLSPVIVNRYRRLYFVSANGHLRLTVDTDLEFFDARGVAGGLTPLPVSVPPVILELKYAPEHAPEAADAASALPFRLTRCSKYVLGVERLPAV